MNCPVCKRELAPTLSICTSCGAMMNDTVREELETKITFGSVAKTASEPIPPPIRPLAPMTAAAPKLAVPADVAPMLGRGPTAELSPPKTSPTLVGFQKKETAIPEWRLQMQNAVRQRVGSSASEANAETRPGIHSGAAAAARKAHIKPEPKDIPVPENADPRLANAIGRISASRRTFGSSTPVAQPARAEAPRSFPFNVVSPTTSKPPVTQRPNAVQESKPVLVHTPPMAAAPRDTNRLPKIDAVVARSESASADVEQLNTSAEMPEREFEGIKRIVISAGDGTVEETVRPTDAFDEIEDLAPFSLRFNAALFDLIIGAVVAMVLLSPFALSGSNWFSISGILTFTAMIAIVMFVYLTAAVGFLGKTLGMRLFSLEIVDAEENEYPTMQQAAVSSSIYLMSLLFAGAGFLTMFFNEERRAAHDLLSGTIIVREF